MYYRISFSEEAESNLKRLPRDIAIRRRDKFKWLEKVNNPRKYLRKVEGIPDGPMYRYRIGDYRAFLTFEDDKLIIIVIAIGKRENIYTK